MWEEKARRNFEQFVAEMQGKGWLLVEMGGGCQQFEQIIDDADTVRMRVTDGDCGPPVSSGEPCTLVYSEHGGEAGEYVRESERAAELARKAAAVGSGGISADDPEAVEKLTDKRTELEQRRDHMKSANAYYKAHKTLDGWEGPAAVAEDGRLTLRVTPYHRCPFPPYALQNIGARIRDAAKRAARLETTAELVASGTLTTTTHTTNGYTITEDPAENRVLITAPARLSRDDYKTVRRYGFVWSPTRSAFARKRTGPATVAHADACARALTPVTAGEPRADT